MNKDKALGLLIFAGSIAGIVLYGWLLFFTTWYLLVLQLTAFLALSIVLAILAWIGYTLATTPPPPSIEELEKQVSTENTTGEQDSTIEKKE